jgi:hypothetical protein
MLSLQSLALAHLNRRDEASTRLAPLLRDGRWQHPLLRLAQQAIDAPMSTAAPPPRGAGGTGG